MTKVYAMTPADVHEQLEEPLHLFRTYLNRMTYTMQDLMEGYFQNPNMNPDNKDDWWALAYNFKRNATRAEIVDDSIAHLRGVLSSLESIDCCLAEFIKTICSEGENPVEEKPAAVKPSSDTPNIRRLAKQISSSPDPDAALAMVGAIAKYGASVRAASKKKAAQAVATSGDAKGGEDA